MSLLYIDSFDYFPAAGTQVFPAYLSQLNYYNINGWYFTLAGAFGGQALSIDNRGNVGTMTADLVIPAAGAGVSEETIIGQRMIWNGYPLAQFVVGASSYGSQFSFTVNNFGALVFKNYDGTILAISAPGLIQMGGWNYFECRFTIGSRMRIRINTGLIIDYSGDFGRPSPADNTWNYLTWQGSTNNGGSNVMISWDDLYVLTTTGDVNNDYLGNVRVRMQLPSGPGDVTDLTPTGAATDWEAQLNTALATTKYASTATVGNYDLYALQANSAARNIFGMQVRGCFLQDDATQLTGVMRLKTGGSEFDATTSFLLSSSNDTYYGIWDQNPLTEDHWTNADLNALQVGPKLLASA